MGVLRTDGVVEPSPACKRALGMVEDALRREGHDIVEVSPPDMFEALRIASRLLNADGCRMFESFRRAGEWNDSGAAQMRKLAKLPGPLRYVYYLWVKYIWRDAMWAELVRYWRPLSAWENWYLVKEREAYRNKWFQWWNEEKLDVILTPPNATPAVPHDGMYDAVSSCGYTFLFNLVSSPGEERWAQDFADDRAALARLYGRCPSCHTCRQGAGWAVQGIQHF